ncbi:MAG: heavy metal translocating P-type ATPase metal-binding domain-containing protein, partial [Planctomycetota bacterium]|nr:heavy metal translocating P-type ATPase metal-binding domain-containing protein [Planctomycetota bacterium]
MIAPARQLDLPGQPLRGDRLGAGAPIECSHCSLPVPAGLVRENSDLQFCCRGCETVYTVIHAHGLERYYALRDASNPDAPEPARVRADGYAEYDDPAFQRLHVSTTAAGLSRIDLYLEGIHCAACVWLIERLPQITNGVIESRLDFRRSLLSIT